MSIRRFIGITSAVIALGALGACSQGPAVSEDYEINHPLKVERKSVGKHITFPDGEMTRRDADSIRAVAERFLLDGEGSLFLKGEGDHLSAVMDILVSEGVPPSRMEASRSSVPGVSLRFSAYVVDLPECGFREVGAVESLGNSVHRDWGCSTQRNLGAMIADPLDLVRPKGYDGKRTEGSVRAIEGHRSQAPDTLAPASINN